MEDNQSTMLPEQQASVADNAQNVAETQAPAVEAVTETEGVTISADVAHITAENLEEAAEAAEAEEAVSVSVKTAEELKALSNDELVAYLQSLMGASSARQVHSAVSDVKAEMKARVDAIVEKEKAQAATAEAAPAEGDAAQPAAHAPAEWEEKLTEVLKLYDTLLAKEREDIRKQEEENAKAKQALIDKLALIVENSKENPSSHQRAVKELTAEWKTIGHVPADKKELNAKFHALTDEFYNSLKVDRELRELDMRRNLAEKIKLCEEAEALAEETNIAKAFAQMQRLHANWKAIGRVSREESDKVWERFRAASNVINKNRHRQIEADIEREKANYEVKLKICEEVEALAENLNTQKEIDNAVQQMQEYQQKWRSVGFAPREVNDEIYARFRAVCDKVFSAKRSQQKARNAKQAQNLRKKEELCEKAEAVMNSTDWKNTATVLIDLQKEWKEIGAVAQKHSDAIWKRFRKACDTFFDNRQNQQDADNEEMVENLAKKQAIIEELKSFVVPAKPDVYLKQVQAIMSRWNSIGFVPMKDKPAINKEYSDLISKHFDALNMSRTEGDMQRFRGRIQAAAGDHDRVSKERGKLMAQLRQAEQDVETLENNIGFFAKSKNSEGIVADVKRKIEKAKAEVEQIAKKIALLDEMGK